MTIATQKHPVNLYPFVHSPCRIESLITDNDYKALVRLEEIGDFKKLSLAEREQTGNRFNELWHSDAYRSGQYRQHGWVFDFRPFMTRFLVKTKLYGWQEVWSFKKKYIRKNAATPSGILEIIEAPIK